MPSIQNSERRAFAGQNNFGPSNVCDIFTSFNRQIDASSKTVLEQRVLEASSLLGITDPPSQDSFYPI